LVLQQCTAPSPWEKGKGERGLKSKMMWKNKMLSFAMLHRPFSFGEGEGGRGRGRGRGF